MLEYPMYRFGEFLTLIFPWGIAYRLGKFFATIQFYLSKKDREAVIGNMRVLMPDADHKTVYLAAKEVFKNFGLYLVEFFRAEGITRTYIERYVKIKNREILDAALTQKKGVILLTAHIGNWELGGMALSLLGYPVLAIALDHKDHRVNKFFKNRRMTKGIEVVSLGKAGRVCFKALKHNKCVAIVGDRDFSDSGYVMDFCGKTKTIPRGPAMLSLKSGALIVPAFVIREKYNHLTLKLLPAIQTEGMNEKQIMELCASIIESQIYAHPTQWLMFREFWNE